MLLPKTRCRALQPCSLKYNAQNENERAFASCLQLRPTCVWTRMKAISACARNESELLQFISSTQLLVTLVCRVPWVVKDRIYCWCEPIQNGQITLGFDKPDFEKEFDEYSNTCIQPPSSQRIRRLSRGKQCGLE